MSREVFVLSEDSGLLGIPARVTEANSETSDKTSIGWEVEFFLNGAIHIDDYVKLESKTVTGYFRVAKLTQAGDNISGDWTCTARLMEVQEFVQEIQNTVQRGLRGIHTAMPGQIVSFDAAKGIATVKPAMKFKKPDGKTMDFPQVTGVPVVFPQGNAQGAIVAFPVKPGDSCLLVVAEQSLDYWQYGQETSTDLAFDMTNAICIPGLFAQGNPVVADACAQNAVIVDVKGTRLTVKGGSVTISAPEVTVEGNLTVTGSLSY